MSENRTCSYNCPLCVWWECPILDKNRPRFFNKKRAVIMDVKRGLDKKAILYYCPVHEKYFVDIALIKREEIVS